MSASPNLGIPTKFLKTVECATQSPCYCTCSAPLRDFCSTSISSLMCLFFPMFSHQPQVLTVLTRLHPFNSNLDTLFYFVGQNNFSRDMTSIRLFTSVQSLVVNKSPLSFPLPVSQGSLPTPRTGSRPCGAVQVLVTSGGLQVAAAL